MTSNTSWGERFPTLNDMNYPIQLPRQRVWSMHLRTILGDIFFADVDRQRREVMTTRRRRHHRHPPRRARRIQHPRSLQQPMANLQRSEEKEDHPDLRINERVVIHRPPPLLRRNNEVPPKVVSNPKLPNLDGKRDVLQRQPLPSLELKPSLLVTRQHPNGVAINETAPQMQVNQKWHRV